MYRKMTVTFESSQVKPLTVTIRIEIVLVSHV